MAYLDTRELKARGAAAAGSFRSETRRLVLLYCGVMAAISLGANGLNLYLDSQIGSTGGLGGVGMRSILQTIQEVLTYVNLFFGPFWSAGFLFSMLDMVRGTAPRLEDLTEGFRRFGRILGAVAFEFLTVVLLMMSAVNLAGVVFSLSPMGMEFAQELAPILEDPAIIGADGALNLELLPMDVMSKAAIPMVIITLLLSIPVYLWLTYGFRMVMYLIVERPIGGVRAHFESLRLMRGHKWQLLKLDLRFWWYHGLGAVIAAVGYLDVILGMLGIAVPVDPMVMFFGTLVAYCVLNMLLSLWKKCEVDAAYVLAYEAIAHPEPIEALSETE